MIKIATFNVNSIRTRIEHLAHFLKKTDTDIIGLQEIKVSNDQFPIQKSADWPYEIYINGQKGYHGVAILSKTKASKTQLKIDFERDQARFSYAQYQTNKAPLHFINCYFPQGENRSHPQKFPYKQHYYREFLNYLNANFTPQDFVFIVGDFNIAPLDVDITIGEENAKRWLKTGKCCFLPEEREMIGKLFDWGLVDCYRQKHPQASDMTWFDYRSRGFEANPKRGLRIDYGLCSKSLMEYFVDSSIDFQTRGMERPSDHCPVLFEFDLTIDD